MKQGMENCKWDHGIQWLHSGWIKTGYNQFLYNRRIVMATDKNTCI